MKSKLLPKLLKILLLGILCLPYYLATPPAFAQDPLQRIMAIFDSYRSASENVSISIESGKILILTSYDIYEISLGGQHTLDQANNRLVIDQNRLDQTREILALLRRLFIADADVNPYLDPYKKKPFQLTSLQEQAIASAQIHLEETSLTENRRGLIVMPTGTGKTEVVAEIVRRYFPGKRILFLVHLTDAVRQAFERFHRRIPERSSEMGFYFGEEKTPESPLLFASRQTLSRPEHLQRFARDRFDLIILDETHHIGSEEYRRIMAYFNATYLGLTATPFRMDAQNILEQLGGNLVYRLELAAAMREGYLVEPEYHLLSDRTDYRSLIQGRQSEEQMTMERDFSVTERERAIVDHYVRLSSRKKTVVFCNNIEHARRMAAVFNHYGVSAYAIDSKMKTETPSLYEEVIRHFKEGLIEVLVTINLFNESIDIPDIQTVVRLRKTQSAIIFFQQLGRGLRLAPGKKKLIVLDFVGNYPTLQHFMQLLDFLNVDLEGNRITRTLPGDRRKIDRDAKTFDVLSIGRPVHLDEAVIQLTREIGHYLEGDFWTERFPEAEAPMTRDEWLKDNYTQYTLAQLAERLGVSRDIIRQRLAFHRLDKSAPWNSAFRETDVPREAVLRVCLDRSLSELTPIFGVGERTIRDKIDSIDLTHLYDWNQRLNLLRTTAIDFLLDNRNKKTPRQIAKILGISEIEVKAKLIGIELFGRPLDAFQWDRRFRGLPITYEQMFTVNLTRQGADTSLQAVQELARMMAIPKAMALAKATEILKRRPLMKTRPRKPSTKRPDDIDPPDPCESMLSDG